MLWPLSNVGAMPPPPESRIALQESESPAAAPATTVNADVAKSSPTRPADSGQPVDLRPRPLGPRPSSKPAASVGANQSAAAALWDNQFIRTGASLGLVLMLIVVLAAIAKRVSAKSGGLAAAMGAGGKAPAGLLEVLGRYPLSRGQTLILLKLDSRVLLLAQTQPRIRGGVGSLTTLCEVTGAEDVASILVKTGEHEGNAAASKFSALLHAFDRTHASEIADHTEISGHEPEAELSDAASQTAEPVSQVIHKFPHPPHPMESPFQALQAAARQPSYVATGTDSFGNIRQRLHALKGEAHR